MKYAVRATRQLDALQSHYERKGRVEAARNLQAAMADAERRIECDPGAGLPAPRSYPDLARPDRAWIKQGRYWITYSLTSPPVIMGVFYETADIPRRS